MKDETTGIEYDEAPFLVEPGVECLHLYDASRNHPTGVVKVIRQVSDGLLVRYAITGEIRRVSLQALRALIPSAPEVIPVETQQQAEKLLPGEVLQEDPAPPFVRGPEGCNDCNVLVPFKARCNRHPEHPSCAHEDSLQWPDVMWCTTCGAIYPLHEAQDLPVGEWSLPVARTELDDSTPPNAALLKAAQRRRELIAPAHFPFNKVTQLLHFMNLVIATMHLEAVRTPQSTQFLRGLYKHLAHDAESIGLQVDENTDLSLILAQVSDALREIAQ